MMRIAGHKLHNDENQSNGPVRNECLWATLDDLCSNKQQQSSWNPTSFLWGQLQMLAHEIMTKISCASLPVSLTLHTHLLVQWSADCHCWQMLTICYFLAAVEGWLQNLRNGKETPQDMTFCFTQGPSSSQYRFSEKTDIQWQAII